MFRAAGLTYWELLSRLPDENRNIVLFNVKRKLLRLNWWVCFALKAPLWASFPRTSHVGRVPDNSFSISHVCLAQSTTPTVCVVFARLKKKMSAHLLQIWGSEWPTFIILLPVESQRKCKTKGVLQKRLEQSLSSSFLNYGGASVGFHKRGVMWRKALFSPHKTAVQVKAARTTCQVL